LTYVCALSLSLFVELLDVRDLSIFSPNVQNVFSLVVVVSVVLVGVVL